MVAATAVKLVTRSNSLKLRIRTDTAKIRAYIMMKLLVERSTSWGTGLPSILTLVTALG